MPALCGAGNGTRGFWHTRQALCQMDHIPRPDNQDSYTRFTIRPKCSATDTKEHLPVLCVPREPGLSNLGTVDCGLSHWVSGVGAGVGGRVPCVLRGTRDKNTPADSTAIN